VDPEAWLVECDLTEEYLQVFGNRVPGPVREQLQALRHRLEVARG
jgi:phosphoenolpyruvate carboxykinase (GTP)